MKKSLILFTLLLCGCSMCQLAVAQSLKTAYHLKGFVYGHELNPAFQPDSNYISLPILGNTTISTESSMGLGDFIYNTSDGGLTTFMSPGTISKQNLLDKVGSGFRNSISTKFTIISLGRRYKENRYQTLTVNLRAEESMMISDGFFDMLKNVENKTYDLSGTSLNSSLYAEIGVGESRILNSKWTVGAKAKLLFGLANADMRIENMTVNLSKDVWSAQGNVTLNASGIDYTTTTEDFNSLQYGKRKYTMVDGFKYGSIGLNGMGLSFDLGATYNLDDHWTFSASLLDLGFIGWFKSNRAENNGEAFTFDGFHNANAADKDNSNYGQSLENQVNKLGDDVMNLIHLEDKGKVSNVNMLGATIHLGASYNQKHFTVGALLTTRIQGKCSWVEGRISGTYKPWDCFDITLAPSYSTYGFAMGGMLNFHHKKGYHVFLGSDCLFFKANKQCIPTSLSGAISFGAAFPIGHSKK